MKMTTTNMTINNNEQDDDEYAPSSPPPASAAEWQAFQDDDGRTYYYNESTGESSWEVPEGFIQDEYANPPSNDDVEDENDCWRLTKVKAESKKENTRLTTRLEKTRPSLEAEMETWNYEAVLWTSS